MNGDNSEDIVNEVKRLRQRLYEIERLLAPSTRETIAPGQLTVLITRVGQERFALQHHSIDEIVPMARLTRAPDMDPWNVGLLNLRGKMIPVIDILARFQKKSRRLDLSDFIVICQTNGRPVGLVVQEVIGIQTIKSEEVHPPPKDVPFAPHLIGALEIGSWPALLLSVKHFVETLNLPNDNG